MAETDVSGTYIDKQVPRVVIGAFLVVALVMVLVPFVGMIWARTETTTENRELAAAPSLTTDDGSFNVNILADAGDYFNDHFAYRNEAVALNAHLRAMLGTSATDQVIVGTDGWLYYAGTLNDYLGRSLLSDRGLANIAHNLKLVQGYVESKGASFVFTIAPNKNNLYDDNMPESFIRYSGASNAEKLAPLLEEAGVTYVDLFELIASQDDVLYFKRDTHWDNRGALLAARALLQSFGRADALAEAVSPEVRDDFVGDLQSMLYPGEEVTEPNYYYEGYHETDSSDELLWSYVEGQDVTDSWVKTSGVGEDSAFVFRDSFGNALLPYLAVVFGDATFSKLVPYNISASVQSGADVVVIERAERHVSDLATAPPVMANPRLKVKLSDGIPEGAREVQASIDLVEDGSYFVVSGMLDDALSPDARIYVRAQQGQSNPVFYDPFWMSFTDEQGQVVSDSGFKVYIPMSSIDIDATDFKIFVR